MSSWADWFPVTPADAEQIRQASLSSDDADDEVLGLLQPWLDRLEELPLHVDMDKAWEPIHRCLTGDDSPAGDFDFDAGAYPLKLCVLGGAQLLEEVDRSAALISANDVRAVADALAGVNRDWLRKRFLAIPEYDYCEIDDESFAWMWEHFERLPPFFAGVATAGSAVICTVSH